LPVRIFLSVGEPSGDLHGSNLVRRLKQHDDSIECVGFGGPKMAAAGCDIHYDLTQMAVMFFWEVVKKLRFFFRLVDQAEEYFQQNKVDAVVLIDYPGFNWHIAKRAEKHGIPVYYYGAPQMWAWAPWRVRKIRKFVDHVLCKLPFEVDWFAQRNCDATFVGHPYFDQLATQTYDESFLRELEQDSRPLITLLPGSRNQEVDRHLPILLDAAETILAEVPECRIEVACFNEKHSKLANQMLKQRASAINAHVNRTPELMRSSTLCLACSGSVSLELLHYRKPTIIVYQIARWMMLAQAVLLRTRFITLVNLIAAKDIRKRTWAVYNPDAVFDGTEEPAVMPEYVTVGNPAPAVARKAITWLKEPQLLAQNAKQLDGLAREYAKPGATDRAAEWLLERLSLKSPSEISNDQSAS
jgi:lipid-A-disaccharide synthase